MRYVTGLKILSVLLFALVTSTIQAKDDASATGKNKSFADLISGLDSHSGLLTVHIDKAQGKVYLELPAADKDRLFGRYIYSPTLRGGLGSNPVGLDRSAGSRNTYIIAFHQVGNKVIVEAENWRYRATADNVNEGKAVRESFASSILWSAKILARHPENNHLLIDFGSFLTRDAVGVAARLAQTEQGQFRLNEDRSMPDVETILVFSQNLEFDAYQTFTSPKPGPEVKVTTPEPTAITLIAHHSIIKLPDDGYIPRSYDDRAAVIGVSFADYSAALDESVKKKWARRFRLEKIDPDATRSKVKKPIIFYVDNGAPEPVRSALVEGAGWWSDAFEEAGFIDAYRVEVLPTGVHPLDARYNVIQWVHRATRGWSYGGAIADPRTGETIRGAVILGSLRVRQDRMIFEGLAGTAQTGMGTVDDPINIALARIRQLAAHEVGHSLGFQHNMAASSYDNRASVMDYPAPEVGVKSDGTLDFSDAYAVGIGSWDKFTVKYLYSQLASEVNEATALEAMIREAYASGHRYVADQDARPADSAHSQGSLWDFGTDPVVSLQNTMTVRKIALSKFGLTNIQKGESVSSLREVIVPIYLYHRYQLEAATKVLGGMTFNYGVRGDGQPVASVVDASYQRQALNEVLDTINPEVLDLPDQILNLLTPSIRNFREGRFGQEMFKGSIYPSFDMLGAADVAAGLTLSGLLNPARAGRLIEFHRRDPENPDLEEVLNTMTNHVFVTPKEESPRYGEIRRVIQERLVVTLLEMTASDKTSATVKARVDAQLDKLTDRLSHSRSRDSKQRALQRRLVGLIERHFNRPANAVPTTDKAPEIPPGSPIGNGMADYCWHCSSE